MEPPLDTLNAFRPRTGTPEQWNAAFIRVEDYLRAHRVHNRLQQITILEKVIARAAKRHEQNPSLDPTTLAAEEVDRMMDEWFGENAEHLGSYAMVPLATFQTIGLIVLGSPDPERFYPEMGTLHLKRLGELVCTSITRYDQAKTVGDLAHGENNS